MTCSSLISIISVSIVLGSSAGTSYLLIISQIHLGLELHLFHKSLHTVNCRRTLKFKCLYPEATQLLFSQTSS